MAWLPAVYPVRNLLERKVSTVLTMAGIALVVFTFVAVMAMADGIRSSFTRAGSDRNVVLLRHGATAETASMVMRETLGPVRATAGIATGADGRELVSAESLVQCLMKRSDGTRVNVALRGVTPIAYALRERLRISEGRRPEPGTDEVLVGRSLASAFHGLSVGGRFKIGRLAVQVVGILEADGSALESEIWIDQQRITVEYRREYYSSILVRLTGPDAAEEFAKRAASDARIGLTAIPERQYYAGLHGGADEVRGLGLLMAFFMACGAVFGAMNTMYQAVAGRTRELATLRALGFSRASVLSAILVESLLLCAIGGVVGCVISLPLGGWELRTVSLKNLTEVGYRLDVSPALLCYGWLLSLALGALGGLLPAWQSTRLNLVEALRQA